MGVKDMTLEAYLSSIAAPAPTPGGGSVSALVGALSVALARMVAGLAMGKKGYEDAQDELRRLEARALPLQDRLASLADEDSAAYERVLNAMRMSKATDAERVARVQAMQAAYREATNVPLETVERCVEALEMAREVAERGSRAASTDCGVAILLAEAAMRGASLNVRVNLSSLKDESFRTAVESKLGALQERGEKAGHDAMSIIEGRI